MKLTWDPTASFGNGMGAAISSTKRVRLASRPDLAFDFDSISYDTDAPVASKSLAGADTALTSDELATIATFLANLP